MKADYKPDLSIHPTVIDIHGYADDHELKKCFAGSSRNEEHTTIRQLADSTNTIKPWMNSNKLKMNSDKTEFVLIGSQQQLRKVEISDININTDLRHLGADLDELLTWKAMTNWKCGTAMSNLLKLIR